MIAAQLLRAILMVLVCGKRDRDGSLGILLLTGETFEILGGFDESKLQIFERKLRSEARVDKSKLLRDSFEQETD
jgi:hypothetical protein